jgi:hypothetical protein
MVQSFHTSLTWYEASAQRLGFDALHDRRKADVAGELLASALADGDDRLKQFPPFGLNWAFSQFGRVGVQGTYWWMQACDRHDERFKKHG